MYESHYGLQEKPFNLTPDPDYLYMSPGHENAYTHLEYAIEESKGFVVVTGEVGSGKTTLINYLLRKIPQTIHVGIINNTFVQPQELLRMICHEFELQYEDSEKTSLLTRFYNYLLEQYSKRERVILIIDEAQNLPEKSLEEIRMLSNLESEKHHLIQMILIGQPQLKDKLQGKRLEQFVQRVTVYCHLDGLEEDQVENYIRHRLKIAGAQNMDLFAPDAIQAIYRHSQGIPRLINTLCDAALVYGYADDVRVIGGDLIEAVAQARSIGAAGSTRESFCEEGERGGELPTDSRVPLREIESRILALEERLAAQELGILKVNQSVEAMNGHKDGRDKIMVKLLRMLKKSMEDRARLMMQIVELQSEIEEREGRRSEGGNRLRQALSSFHKKKN
jgi:general secretion pathway protein A